MSSETQYDFTQEHVGTNLKETTKEYLSASDEFPIVYNQCLPYKSLDEPIKILAFGSSWFLCTWFYLNKICRNLGINATIHGYYMGHSQFDEWISFYYNDLTPFAGAEATRQAFRYVSENGADYSPTEHITGGTFGDQEYRDSWYNDLTNGDFDLVIFQQGAHQCAKWQYWTNYRTLVSIIKRSIKPDAVIGFNSTWTPSVGSRYITDDSGAPATREGQKRMQQMNYDNTVRLMRGSGIDVVSPCGATLYTMRNDSAIEDDYDLCRDQLHPTNGLPMYGMACTLYQTFIAPIYGISIDSCTWMPTASTQRSPFSSDCFLPINAAQQGRIHQYARLALSNRFGFNEALTPTQPAPTISMHG